jgi:hypothetical protein
MQPQFNCRHASQLGGFGPYSLHIEFSALTVDQINKPAVCRMLRKQHQCWKVFLYLPIRRSCGLYFHGGKVVTYAELMN